MNPSGAAAGCEVAQVDGQGLVAEPLREHRAQEVAAFHQHVEGRDLALPFGDDPMFDADALARDGVGPPCDVAGCVDVRRARFHEFIHAYALVDREARFFGEREAWTDADANHHQITLKCAAALQRDAFPID